MHRPHSHSNSLKDVSSFYDFPPPPTISYQFEEPAAPFRGTPFPRDATANTMSTTADVVCDELFAAAAAADCGYDDYSPGGGVQHEFVTFDLDRPLPMRAQSTLSVSSRNGDGKACFDAEALRRTTPV